MRLKPLIRILFITAFLIFVLNKFYLRPLVLKMESFSIAKVFVYSVPNLCEAIMGTIVATALLFMLNNRLKLKLRDIYVYVISISFASIYVISQELKYHNIGGNNIYDFNDLVASIIGLLLMAVVLFTFGFWESPIERNPD